MDKRKYMLFIGLQHSPAMHEMIVKTIKPVITNLPYDCEVSLCAPDDLDLSYIADAADLRIVNYVKASEVVERPSDFSEYQPILMYNLMYGKPTREANTEEYHQRLHNNLSFVKAIDYLMHFNTLRYFIVDPTEVDPEVFSDSNRRIERYYYMPLYDGRDVEVDFWFMSMNIESDKLHRGVAYLPKVRNCSFALTAYNDERKSEMHHYENHIRAVGGWFGASYTGADGNKYDTRKSYMHYMLALKSSRYTFVVPSYSKHTFSIARFVESVSVGCLPLVHKDCNIDVFEKDYPEFHSVLKRLLFDPAQLDSEVPQILADDNMRRSYIFDIVDSDLFRNLRRYNAEISMCCIFA